MTVYECKYDTWCYRGINMFTSDLKIKLFYHISQNFLHLPKQNMLQYNLKLCRTERINKMSSSQSPNDGLL